MRGRAASFKRGGDELSIPSADESLSLEFGQLLAERSEVTDLVQNDSIYNGSGANCGQS
ncbi:MAG TPA: hypothetical protein VF883_13035 [Thermoanaerobaculia bacterium]